MTTLKLFKMTGIYESLMDELYDEETGEVNETTLSRLNDIGDQVEQKAIAIASFIQNLEAERKAVEDAKNAMSYREIKLHQKQEWLKSYLISNMERTGKTEISCPYFVIKLKKNPPSTHIINEDNIPEQYKNRKEVVSINKVKIKDDIKKGIEVPGAELTQTLKLDIK